MFKIHFIIFASNCNFVSIGTTIEFTSIYRLDVSKISSLIVQYMPRKLHYHENKFVIYRQAYFKLTSRKILNFSQKTKLRVL